MNTVLHRVLQKQHLKSEDQQGGSEVKGTSPTTLANPIPSLEPTKMQKKSDSTALSSNLDRHQYTHAHTQARAIRRMKVMNSIGQYVYHKLQRHPEDKL